MSHDKNGGTDDQAHVRNEEANLRRYEARIGLWKVVLGTCIVGLAGVLIPGAISFYTAYVESIRQDTELKLAREQAHQQYIKEFFNTAINQDIELRIRFAEYFANLSGETQRSLWMRYLSDLQNQKQDKRNDIQRLEEELVRLKGMSEEKRDVAKFEQVERQLAWLYAELGYAPIERSDVSPGEVIQEGDSIESIARRARLYDETTELVHSLASKGIDLAQDQEELERFWQLYREDLIDVESRAFAKVMIRIGEILRSPTELDDDDIDQLTRLAAELDTLAQQELSSPANSIQSRAIASRTCSSVGAVVDNQCPSGRRQRLACANGMVRIGKCL